MLSRKMKARSGEDSADDTEKRDKGEPDVVMVSAARMVGRAASISVVEYEVVVVQHARDQSRKTA